MPNLRRFIIWVSAIVCLTAGCAGVLNYETLLRAAKTINLSDGLNKDEAVLLAQRHVILTGLDQDVSVWHVDEVKFMAQQNSWHIIFRTRLDNKVGDRRGEMIAAVTVAVDANTGSCTRFVAQDNP